MPYVKKPRPYKKEYKQQQERDELPRRMERQRARRKMDKDGVDRTGKDVAHRKALDKGGSNADGVYLTTPSKNRSFKRDSKSNLVSETSKRERKKR